MSWKTGQVPERVWLRRKDVGAKKLKGGKISTRLALGNVKCCIWEPLHGPTKWACYRLVPSKSPLKKRTKR